MFAAPKSPRTAYSLLPSAAAEVNKEAAVVYRRSPTVSRRCLLLVITLLALLGIVYLAESSGDHATVIRNTAQQALSCALKAPGSEGAGLIAGTTSDLGYALSPLSNSSVVLIKTGHSVAHARMPAHLESPRPDIPHRFIYSDYPTHWSGEPFIDILTNITRKNYDQNDMRVYTDLHDAVGNGVLPEDLAAERMWQLDKYKFIPMHAHAYRAVPDAKWYIAMDGDTFIFHQNLLRWLEQFDADKPYYFGNRHTTGSGDGLRVWAQGGSGYVLSKGVMDKTIALDPWGWEFKQDKYLNTERGGDVVIGRLLKETEGLNIQEPHPSSKDLFFGDPISHLEYSPESWLTPIFSLHHLRASEVVELRRFEASVLPTLEPGDYIRRCDVYRHFAPRVLREELDAIFSGSAWGRVTYRIKSWATTNPNAVVFTVGWAEQREVEYDADFCDVLCSERDECMSWTFEDHTDPKERRCIHGRMAFGFGKPETSTFRSTVDGQEHPRVVSGIRLDRIRDIERNLGCGDRARRRMHDAKNGW